MINCKRVIFLSPY